MSTEHTSPPKPSEDYFFRASAADFNKIPGSPIAYWISKKFANVYANSTLIREFSIPRQGLATMDNVAYTRLWFEVPIASTSIKQPDSEVRWYPYNKGGDFKRWYGNQEYLVDWEDSGKKIKDLSIQRYGSASKRVVNEGSYFKQSVTWSKIGSGKPSFRYQPTGAIFDVAGMSIFPESFSDICKLLGFLNSKIAFQMLKFLSPTLNFEGGQIGSLGFLNQKIDDTPIESLIHLARTEWDNSETSWDFKDQPLFRSELKAEALADTWANWERYCRNNIVRMQKLEAENNRFWIDAYGLQDELTSEVPEEEITLARANPKKDMAAFISYAIGCMFGRYSLEKPGLILANAGESLEEYLKQVPEPSFTPDEDNIIPVLDGEWFDDDIVARFREFLKVTFGEATLRENIDFIEESLGKDLRKYFVTDFYKDHLQTYKKRPIYWLFQSPKKSFQALIYLHRYNRDTVNLLLNDYLREFQEKLKNRRKHLDEILASESTSARDKTAATKEQTKIDKALPELADWEREEILPLAQQRLEIDLDDGVKVNYPKFKKALAKIAGVS